MRDRLPKHIASFIFNIVIILLCKLFLQITTVELLVYSAFNSLWMPFVFRPREKNIDKELEPLANYFKGFKNKQDKIEKEKEIEERINDELYKVYRKDWKLFKVYLKKHRIRYLYHFTDQENLKSIINYGGLFSWSYCKKNNIDIERPGSNELSRSLDKKYDLENYVRLSLTSDHPMLYSALKDKRILTPIVLKIDPEIIYLKKVKFSNTNATKSNKEIGDTFDYFNNIKFEVIKNDYMTIDDSEKPYYQAEILIYESVPIKYITNINELI